MDHMAQLQTGVLVELQMSTAMAVGLTTRWTTSFTLAFNCGACAVNPVGDGLEHCGVACGAGTRHMLHISILQTKHAEPIE